MSMIFGLHVNSTGSHSISTSLHDRLSEKGEGAGREVVTGCLGSARQPGLFLDVIQAVVKCHAVRLYFSPFTGETGEGVVEFIL